MILSSLLILALVVASGILLSSMLLPFQLPRVSADSSDTNTDQKLGQENTGSGDTINKNIVTNDVEIEEESATLSVCKEVDSNLGVEPDDFTFTVIGNDPSPEEFEGDANCVDVTIGPGEYEVREVAPEGLEPNFGTFILPGSDCVQDPISDQLFSEEVRAGLRSLRQ
jgi:hypothetical protein